MVLNALVGAGLSIGSSLLGGGGASKADRARAQAAYEAQNAAIVAQLEQIDAQKDVQRAQYKRAVEEWEYNKEKIMEGYYYEVARLDLQKEIDAQQGIDQMEYNAKLIEATKEGFELQAAALEDQYINSENYRAEQVGIEYEQAQTLLGIQTNRNVAQYMQQVQQNNVQMQVAMGQAEGRGRELQNQQILEHAADSFAYQASLISSAIEASTDANTSAQLSGGSQSAQRLAADRMKQAYRAYGQLQQRARGRDARRAQYNELLQSEVAGRAIALSEASGRAADSIAEEAQLYDTQFQAREDMLRDVTLPGFELSQKDYLRELETLQLSSNQILDQATQPYRLARFIDIPEPAVGLKPEFLAPAPVYAPTQAQKPVFDSGKSFADYAALGIKAIAPYASQLVSGLFGGPKGFSNASSTNNISSGFSNYNTNFATSQFSAPSNFGSFSFSTPSFSAPSFSTTDFSNVFSGGGADFGTSLNLDLGF